MPQTTTNVTRVRFSLCRCLQSSPTLEVLMAYQAYSCVHCHPESSLFMWLMQNLEKVEISSRAERFRGGQGLILLLKFYGRKCSRKHRISYKQGASSKGWANSSKNTFIIHVIWGEQNTFFYHGNRYNLMLGKKLTANHMQGVTSTSLPCSLLPYWRAGNCLRRAATLGQTEQSNSCSPRAFPA